MTIPDYTEKIGTPVDDSLIEGLKQEVGYGLQGDDVLAPGYFSDAQGGDAALVGGSGSDRYVIKDRQTLVVIDGSNSDGDILDADGISFNNEDSFFLTYFDSTMLLFDTTNNQLVFLPDWQNIENRIEEFRFEDQTLTYDEFAEQIATNDKYLGSFTESQVIDLPNGEQFNVGISGDLEELNSVVRDVTARSQELENPTLELTGGTAQIAYVAYYGRPADNGGNEFWNGALTDNQVSYSPRNGDSLTGAEQETYDRIVNEFGNSGEADRLFGSIESNRDKVNQVYQFAFDRDGEAAGLDFWEEQIDNGNVTLATFALEVALGAQNQDAVVLNNKINSAELFSNNLDTEAEVTAYTGSAGEQFGRTWLDDFGANIASQEQLDVVLTDFVNA